MKFIFLFFSYTINTIRTKDFVLNFQSIAIKTEHFIHFQLQNNLQILNAHKKNYT